MGTKRHQSAVDKIQAKDKTLKLVVGGLPQTYESFFGALDFADDDLPNWRAVKSISGGIGASDPIPFTTIGSAGLTISNWQTDYASIFGNNPAFIIFTFQSGIEQEDRQTSPIYTRITPGDPASNLTSVFFPYPFATTGYFIIFATSGGTGGSSVPDLVFDETSLISDSGGYYLPLTLPTGKRPTYAESNNIEVKTINYDGTYTPARLYGFPNNTPSQTILVKIS